MDELIRHPVVAPILVLVAFALLGYIAAVARKVVALPKQVAELDSRLTKHLAQEEKDNKSHAHAVTEVHERVDDLYKLLVKG